MADTRRSRAGTRGRRRAPGALIGAVLLGTLTLGACGGEGTSSVSSQPADATAAGGDQTATAPAGGGTSQAPTTQSAPSGGSGVAGGSPGSDLPPSGGHTQKVTGTGGASGPGAPVPWDVSAMPSAPGLPKGTSGTARLTVLLDDGFGVRTTWTLTCDPDGGTHPDPAAACGVLGAKGATALPEPSPTTACTEQYGGPQKAKLTGTWRGKKVDSQLSLENGCQIARWTALLGLLPPGGLPG